jgi:hypothetical protein
MASLSSILGKIDSSSSGFNEQNLEKGKIFTWSITHDKATEFCSGVHWRFPAAGRAVIEVWGAAGSGGKMCCCGAGLPGNPGAYAKKEIVVDTDTYVCMKVGASCGNASTLCMRGCSQATCMYVCSPNGLLTGGIGTSQCICLCAEGGMGGANYCNCSSANYDPINRFSGCNYFVTNNTGCGVVCNNGTTHNWLPTAYGGDTNWSPSEDPATTGRFSCLEVNHCNMCCYDCYRATIVVPPGIWGDSEQKIQHYYACNDWKSNRQQGFDDYMAKINSMSRSPIMGHPFWMCANSVNYCGCYEYQGCHTVVSHAIPGYGGMTCTSIRDHGGRGGHGAIKIRFIRD